MKIWKIAVIMTLAVALVLGVALPGLAVSDVAATQTTSFNSDDEPPAWGKRLPRILRGEVIDIGDRLFVIESGDHEPTIYVSEGTKYFMVTAPRKALAQLRVHPGLGNAELPTPAETKPLFRRGRPELAPNLPQPDEDWGRLQGIRAKLLRLRHLGEEATFDDIEVGNKVVVLLLPGKDKPTAQVVLIIKPSVWGRIAGTITDVSDDSITIEPVSGGDEVLLEYDENTIFILKGITGIDAEAEQFARAVYNTETMVAKVVRVWPDAPQPAD